MTPSKALFVFCISFITGIALQSTIKIPQIFVWGFLVLGASSICASFLTKKNIFAIFGFCILFFALSVARVYIVDFNIESNSLKKMNDLPEKVVLAGKVASEPDIKNNFQKLRVKVGNSIILVTANNYPEYQYLDEVKLTGNLKSPPEFPTRSSYPPTSEKLGRVAGGEGFNYKSYLMKDGIYSVMDFPKIELTSKEHKYNIFSFLYENILILKSKLIESLGKSFSAPQNFIIRGVVFGNDNDWPKDLKESFNMTGLSHITAISGGNIIILLYILMPFFLFLGLWRGQAFYFAIGSIWLYIVLVGFPASSIRAGIMGSMLLLAEKLGRQNTSSRTVVLAGTLMILQNPLLLIYDIGFQLSFLASLGIIHVKPAINHFFSFIGAFVKKTSTAIFLTKVFGKNNPNNNDQNKEKSRGLGKKIAGFALDIVAVTLSAQIFTLPVVAYNFGVVSLISPLTNLLILPIVPPLMVLGLLSSIFGVFSGFLGWVFALPCYIMIYYLLKVLDIFSQSFFTTQVQNIHWALFIIYYLLLIGLIFYLNRKIKPKFLGY